MAKNVLISHIGSLSHELRPPITFVLSVQQILADKMPDIAENLWFDLGVIGKRLLGNIEDEIGDMLVTIDSYSPVTASVRIRALADAWEKDADRLLQIVQKVSELKIHLEDPKLNLLLNEHLPNYVQRFCVIVSKLKTIQPEELSAE